MWFLCSLIYPKQIEPPSQNHTKMFVLKKWRMGILARKGDFVELIFSRTYY